MDALSIKRAKHAEYMRKWYARRPGYKAAADAAYRSKNIEALREKGRIRGKEYRAKNGAKANAASRRWERAHRKECAAHARNWRIRNPEKAKATSLKFRLKHRDRILAKRRERRRLNINGCRDKDKAWQRNNRDKVIAARRKLYPVRRQNISRRIEDSLRARINAFVTGRRNKSASTMALLGCSLADFKIYIESKFEPGMSWENYGKGSDKWNLDHEMPCAIFDLTKPEHQKRCFHFSNLQPLWQPENESKNAKVLTNQFNLL